MIEAVVFDMDGVIVDSEGVWERVRRDYVAERGGTWPHDAQHRLMGMSTTEWAAYLARDFGFTVEPEAAARDVIDGMAKEYAVRLPVIPGAVEVLRRIGAGWPVAIASSSPPSLIEAVLETAGLTSTVPVWVSSEQVARGKPAPDVYLAAAARLGVEPSRCAAVEDSSNGLRSAAAAGMAVLAVPRPEYPPAADALALAVKVLHDVTDLTDELLRAL